MRYLSVCSGIEAATVAWKPLGWQAVGFSEIEKFPAAVLAHHYPDVPNFGDMTKFKEWPDDLAPDVLVGGTPCQSFSVAGLRKGLDDPRGNLMLTFGAIAAKYRPEWLVWENVPGVLSSNGGRDFGTFLGMLAELGYGFAYRVLDAQYFGVAQRRRRVFVVANARDWRRAAAVLFERHSLSGDPAPRREAGQGTALGVIKGAAIGRQPENGPQYGDTLTDGSCYTLTCNEVHAVAPTISARTRGGGGLGTDFDLDGGLIPTIGGGFDIAHTLRGEGFDASEYGTGRGTPLVPVPFDTTQITSAANYSSPKPGDPCHPLAAGAHAPAIAIRTANTSANGHGVSPELAHTLDQAQGQAVAFSCKDHGADDGPVSPTLRSMGHDGSHANAGGQVAVAFGWQNSAQQGDSCSEHVSPTLDKSKTPAVAFAQNQRDEVRTMNVVGALAAEPGAKQQTYLQSGMAVRRLTPVECERLQGFPDGYTAIRWRSKPASECPDGPRYKALGNSMAVPVMAWIGERIAAVAAQENMKEVA